MSLSLPMFRFPGLNARSLLRGGLALLMATSLAACGGLEDDDRNDSSGEIELSGTIQSLNTTAKTFVLQGRTVNYDSGATIFEDGTETDLANGIRVEVDGTLNADGVSVDAVHIDFEDDDTNDAPDEPMDLSGEITDFVDMSSFKVQGVPVDASGAINTAGVLSNGKLVEMEGRLENGVFIATRIETEDDTDFDGLEIWGAIESLDTTAKTFVLQGVTVNYVSGTTIFDDGVEANLANGVLVEVEGTLNADGESVDAVRIEFDD